jgi:hypothetical protein
MAIGRRATTSEIKNKNKKPNLKLNILDESYLLNNESIA